MKRPLLLLFSAIALVGTAVWVYYENFYIPILESPQTWLLKPYAPEIAEKNFRVTPFFYTAGSFKTQVLGQPLFVIVPYRKGPPLRFISQVQFHWSSPTDGKGRITIQGPKTPVKDYTLDLAKKCIDMPAHKVMLSSDCIAFRNQALKPVFSEMQKTESKPRMRWFEVENSQLSADQRAQGLYVSAIGAKEGIEAWILILPQGSLQVYTATFSRTPGGEALRLALEQSIRSMRIDTSIGTHRAWIDREIAQVNLQNVMKIADPIARMTALAEVQFLLASKLSVDPSKLEPYFHLGGTSRLLHAEAQKQKRFDWGANARDLAQDMVQYSRDLDRLSPKTAELERLLADMRKE